MNLEILLRKIEKVLDNKISFVDFSEWYEEWFPHDVQQKSYSKEVFGLLENFYTDIGFYEPNPEIRKEHSLYFGNEVLRMKMIELMENLKP